MLFPHTRFVFIVALGLISAPALAEDLGDVTGLIEIETLKQLDTGFQFTEGPVWNTGGFLLFSDIPANLIYKWEEGKKSVVFRDPSHESNGLTYDREGRLLACEHKARRVTRTHKDGTIEVLADNYEGKKLNSPNDIVVARDGTIYFTDPPYGISHDPTLQELDFQGIYRIDPAGKLHLEHKGFKKPNGIGLSPDQKTLYVADTEDTLYAFPVKNDASLGEPKPYTDPGLRGGDGLSVDKEGNVWATGSGGIWIWNAKGEWVGKLETPEGPANCCFGGADGRDFYITARTSVYRVRTKVEGIRSME